MGDRPLALTKAKLGKGKIGEMDRLSSASKPKVERQPGKDIEAAARAGQQDVS